MDLLSSKNIEVLVALLMIVFGIVISNGYHLKIVFNDNLKYNRIRIQLNNADDFRTDGEVVWRHIDDIHINLIETISRWRKIIGGCFCNW